MLVVGGDATDGANKDTTDAVDGGGDSDVKMEQVTTQKLGTQVSVYQPPPPNMLVGVGERDLPQLEGVYIQFKVSHFISSENRLKDGATTLIEFRIIMLNNSKHGLFFQATKVFDIFDEDEIRKSVENYLDKLEYVEKDGKKSDPETAIVKASEKSDAPVTEDTIDAATVNELNQQQPPTGNKSVVKLNSKYLLCKIRTAFEQERTEIRQKNAQLSIFDFLSDSSKNSEASGTDLMQYLQKNPMCRVVPKYKKTEMLVKRHGASAMLDTMASICDPYLYGAKRHQKSGLYAWVVLIIAVFYLLPASQLMYKVST